MNETMKQLLNALSIQIQPEVLPLLKNGQLSFTPSLTVKTGMAPEIQVPINPEKHYVDSENAAKEAIINQVQLARAYIGQHLARNFFAKQGQKSNNTRLRSDFDNRVFIEQDNRNGSSTSINLFNFNGVITHKGDDQINDEYWHNGRLLFVARRIDDKLVPALIIVDKDWEPSLLTREMGSGLAAAFLVSNSDESESHDIEVLYDDLSIGLDSFRLKDFVENMSWRGFTQGLLTHKTNHYAIAINLTKNKRFPDA